MLFCPTCNNVLVFVPECREDGVGQYEFSCQTCGYHHTLTSTVSAKITFDVKQPGDVLGGADAWKNVDATEATCIKCENNRAYYMQLQIRSADEHSTIFYRCTNCAHGWREG